MGAQVLLGRGAGRGGRGSGTPTAATSATGSATGLNIPQHIQTVGVRRPAYGTSGTAIRVVTNHFKVAIPNEMIYHYDVGELTLSVTRIGVLILTLFHFCVAMTPDEQKLPTTATMQVIRRLQEVVAPQIFTPRVVYDGRKNLFSIRELPFPDGAQTFDVTLEDPPQNASQAQVGKGPKVYKVKLTQVARINPEVLSRFINSQQASDNTVLTAITVMYLSTILSPQCVCTYWVHNHPQALNVVIRMQPHLQYPFDKRCFYTAHETKDIGKGIVLWRGYFQSIRPAPGRMLINVDTSTGYMYKSGPLIEVCQDVLKDLSSQTPRWPNRALTEAEGLLLQRFLAGVRVSTITANGTPSQTPKTIKGFSLQGANELRFKSRDGTEVTVADYFKRVRNRPLRYPNVICAEVGNGALIPLEMCKVIQGQIMRKQVPDEKVKDVVEFSTRMPQERLESIRNGLGVLAYGQSEYVRHFGLNVDQGTVEADARLLPLPILRYSGDSKFASRFVHVQEGITVKETDPVVYYANPQGVVATQLLDAGQTVIARHKMRPELLVVILPENSVEIYRAVKHFGDIAVGVPTQCMKASKCAYGSPQYFANVCLKVNVKMGGINAQLHEGASGILNDKYNHTIVMGADVIHPPPGSLDRPSFASLVASIDSGASKYMADCRVQEPRQEIIAGLDEMAKGMLHKYMNDTKVVAGKVSTARRVPKRIIFYRDGVSEGQFQQVLDQELPQIRKACKDLGIAPKIVLIVVGKRHHVRFFPKNPLNTAEADERSRNCLAGTVVDRDITHPTEFDFYLLSHGGRLGTSRPAHYNVLHNDSDISVDALQAASFALCHVYARSTCSVSIPAPVYYADIVCSRAKNHYSPESNLNPDQAETRAGGAGLLEVFKKEFKPVHGGISLLAPWCRLLKLEVQRHMLPSRVSFPSFLFNTHNGIFAPQAAAFESWLRSAFLDKRRSHIVTRSDQVSPPSMCTCTLGSNSKRTSGISPPPTLSCTAPVFHAVIVKSE
ncbi:hypothetical protein NM688_g4337 [Phlebia brevispora]|uniref:Uncharacterized protein n=1 Tax=Phlebia brevispora TaxID=194682 RepID=A0ACC1T2X6_9APHY|nr:hypothetical protein NM688_g4337 [Phlebia brevispora]